MPSLFLYEQPQYLLPSGGGRVRRKGAPSGDPAQSASPISARRATVPVTPALDPFQPPRVTFFGTHIVKKPLTITGSHATRPGQPGPARAWQIAAAGAAAGVGEGQRSWPLHHTGAAIYQGERSELVARGPRLLAGAGGHGLEPGGQGPGQKAGAAAALVSRDVGGEGKTCAKVLSDLGHLQVVQGGRRA